MDDSVAPIRGKAGKAGKVVGAVLVFRDATLRAHQTEHRWAARLQQALDEGRFELDLQRVLPGVFKPAAERFHIAPGLDRWVRVSRWTTSVPAPRPSAT